MESAQTILNNVEGGEQPEEGSGTDKLIETVTRYVNMKIKLSAEKVLRTLSFVYNSLSTWIIQIYRIVSDAFETCNVSKTGKLSAKVCPVVFSVNQKHSQT